MFYNFNDESDKKRKIHLTEIIEKYFDGNPEHILENLTRLDNNEVLKSMANRKHLNKGWCSCEETAISLFNTLGDIISCIIQEAYDKGYHTGYNQGFSENNEELLPVVEYMLTSHISDGYTTSSWYRIDTANFELHALPKMRLTDVMEHNRKSLNSRFLIVYDFNENEFEKFKNLPSEIPLENMDSYISTAITEYMLLHNHKRWKTPF